MSTTIKIGHCYMTKLSKKTIPVRVESVLPNKGGWEVRSLVSGRPTVVKAKTQFLHECTPEELDIPREPTRRAAPMPAHNVTETGEKRKLSLLDAAHEILVHAGCAYSTKQLVQLAIDGNYWETQGKTPWGTLHAAISREIANAPTPRFVKDTERGKFRAAPLD
ncbi:MAG: HTH domain-containing protein [Thermoguttaceae bacterium]